MQTALFDSQKFQLGEMGFSTAKREGGEYIRTTVSGFEISVQLTPKDGGAPATRTFAAGELGAGDYKAWMRGQETKCAEGAFTHIVLKRVSKTDD